jgi:cellobiose dehydrogenase (acceptor)
MTAGSYTDSATGIKLKTWAATDGAPYTFGLALPSDALTKDATEYIGLLVGRGNSPWI